MNYVVIYERDGNRFIWARDISPHRIGLYWEPLDHTRDPGSYEPVIYPTRDSAEQVAARLGGTVETY